MVEKNSPRYIDVSPKIVDSYNRTWHSGIRSEPVKLTRKMKNNYGGKCIGQENPMIKIKRNMK